MPQQTTMTLYRDVVLECQHCYMICRYSDAAVRRNCPACGRAIANWAELATMCQEQSLPSAAPASAPTSSSSHTPKA